MIEQTATALTNAMPILAATAFPTLLITAITAAMEWHRLGADDPDWTYDDYRKAGDVIWPQQHHTPDVDAPTQVIPRVLPDAGTPLYDQLAARTTARQWLAELGQAACVNTVYTGGAM